MLYNLIQRRRGKETVVMTDELPKIQDRVKTLRKSHRKGIKGDAITYHIVHAPLDEEKYRRKPHNLNLSGDTNIQHNGPKHRWEKRKGNHKNKEPKVR